MSLHDALIAATGPLADTELFAHDVYRRGGTPAAVVRPTTVAALQAVVRSCADAGAAMVPRGGGASYTDGYLVDGGNHVVFDLSALDSIEVDVANALVTVGPGVTWAALRARLARDGLRTPFWGPFSGLFATVGGSVSQNSVSHGSAAHGISAQSVLSMDVVLASGELLRTAPSSATRHTGPDLTGLFTGDCGALGIKAAIRLPLIAAREHHAELSFAFDDFAAFAAAMRDAGMAGLNDTHFGLDRALSQGQIGKADGIAARARIAADVMRGARNPLAGATRLARMAVAGDAAVTGGAYMAHFMLDGAGAAEVADKARSLRRLIERHGRTMAATVPGFVRAVPFAPFVNILGPKGERWVPLHGILPHDAAAGFHAAFTALLDRRRAEMAALGVWTGTMFSSIGSTGLLYEIALYWPDARTPYHAAMLDAATLAALPVWPDNPAARACADGLKRAAIALLAEHGGVFFQLGRAYPYLAQLDPQAAALIRALKTTLDPRGLMNPGVLGLG